MSTQTELEKDLNAYKKAFDKNKLINLLKSGIPKYFIPIEDTFHILKNNGDMTFKEFFSKEDVSTYLNLSLGWKLHKKVFIIPPDVLTGFLDIGDELTYYSEKDFIFPTSILNSFPYWSNFVNIGKKLSINFVPDGLDGTSTIIRIKLDDILYGIRKYKERLKLYFIVYFTRYVDGKEVKDTLSHYFDINTTDNNNVLSLHYDTLECESVEQSLLQVFHPIIFNIVMYIGTMNKHNPTPYKQTDISLKQLGNKFALPNPPLKEVFIGDHTTHIVNHSNDKKGVKSKLKTHLRKGFWRRQWYGPRNKPEERTMDLIFIPPCIVRGFNEESTKDN